MATFTSGRNKDSERDYSKADMEKLLKAVTKTLSTQTDTLEKYQDDFRKFQEKYAKTKNQEIIGLIENQSKELKKIEEKYSGRMTGGRAVGKAGGMLGEMLLAGNPFGQLVLEGKKLFNDIYPKADREANKKDRALKKLGAKQEQARNILEVKEELKRKQRRKDRDKANKEDSNISKAKQKKEKADLKRKFSDDPKMLAVALKAYDNSNKGGAGKVSKVEKAQVDTAKAIGKVEKETTAKNKSDAKEKKAEKGKGKFLQNVKEGGKDLLMSLIPILILILPALIAVIMNALGLETPKEAAKRKAGAMDEYKKSHPNASKDELKKVQNNLDKGRYASGNPGNTLTGNRALSVVDRTNSELGKGNELTPLEASWVNLHNQGEGASMANEIRFARNKKLNPKGETGNLWDVAKKSLSSRDSGGDMEQGKLYKVHEHEGLIVPKNKTSVVAKKNMLSPESNMALSRMKQKETAQLKEMQTINKNISTINNINNTSVSKTTKADIGNKNIEIRDYSPVSEVLKGIYVFGGSFFN